jgi:hypothetical protein
MPYTGRRRKPCPVRFGLVNRVRTFSQVEREVDRCPPRSQARRIGQRPRNHQQNRGRCRIKSQGLRPSRRRCLRTRTRARQSRLRGPSQTPPSHRPAPIIRHGFSDHPQRANQMRFERQMGDFTISLRIACGTLNRCLSFASAPMTTVPERFKSFSVNGKRSLPDPTHYLVEAGHQRSEGEEVVGSVGEYEIARKPD